MPSNTSNTVIIHIFSVNKMDGSNKKLVTCLNLDNLQLLTRCLRLFMMFLTVCRNKLFAAIICPTS